MDGWSDSDSDSDNDSASASASDRYQVGPGTLYSLYSLDIAIGMITYANPQSLNRAGPAYEIL